eukprot:3268338-Rhodomonas_salina.1
MEIRVEMRAAEIRQYATGTGMSVRVDSKCILPAPMVCNNTVLISRHEDTRRQQKRKKKVDAPKFAPPTSSRSHCRSLASPLVAAYATSVPDIA